MRTARSTSSSSRDRLSVSAATLRRDLALLEEERLLARTHGGAVTTGVTYPLHNRLRDERRDLKRALARVAASRVPGGPQVVALTGGVVTPGLARELADRDRLTVVTNALDIAADLAMRPRLKVVVTGGVTRPKSYSLAGPWAEHLLRDVTIGTAFVEVDALTADGGLMTDDEVEARTVRALIERAERTDRAGRRITARPHHARPHRAGRRRRRGPHRCDGAPGAGRGSA